MKKLKNYKFLFIFVLIFFLAAFFPLTGRDLFFKTANIETFKDLLGVSNGGMLTSILTVLLSKYKILKVLMYGLITTSLFILVKDTINKKNDVLVFIGIFFLILVDRSVFASAIANLSGFTTHIIGSLFLILYIDLFVKNRVENIKWPILLILGVLSTSTSIVYALVIFASTIGYFVYCRHKGCISENFWVLISGEIIGLVFTALTSSLKYTGFSYNLIHGIIPNVSGVNFMIVLISSALIMIEDVKVYNKGSHVGAILSLLGIGIFLFTSLLSQNDYVNYIAYILYFISSFYIIYSFNNSKAFKFRMVLYYIFKLAFIIFSSIVGGITEGGTIFLYIVDIMIILELYNYLFPSNYLSIVWLVVVAFLLGVDIYIYKSVYDKYSEMNFYIKNRLECYTSDFDIPEKYNTEYLYDYIPVGKSDLEVYISYYGISPYGNIDGIDLHFKEQ